MTNPVGSSNVSVGNAFERNTILYSTLVYQYIMVVPTGKRTTREQSKSCRLYSARAVVSSVKRNVLASKCFSSAFAWRKLPTPLPLALAASLAVVVVLAAPMYKSSAHRQTMYMYNSDPENKRSQNCQGGKIECIACSSVLHVGPKSNFRNLSGIRAPGHCLRVPDNKSRRKSIGQTVTDISSIVNRSNTPANIIKATGNTNFSCLALCSKGQLRGRHKKTYLDTLAYPFEINNAIRLLDARMALYFLFSLQYDDGDRSTTLIVSSEGHFDAPRIATKLILAHYPSGPNVEIHSNFTIYLHWEMTVADVAFQNLAFAICKKNQSCGCSQPSLGQDHNCQFLMMKDRMLRPLCCPLDFSPTMQREDQSLTYPVAQFQHPDCRSTPHLLWIRISTGKSETSLADVFQRTICMIRNKIVKGIKSQLRCQCAEYHSGISRLGGQHQCDIYDILKDYASLLGILLKQDELFDSEKVPMILPVHCAWQKRRILIHSVVFFPRYENNWNSVKIQEKRTDKLTTGIRNHAVYVTCPGAANFVFLAGSPDCMSSGVVHVEIRVQYSFFHEPHDTVVLKSNYFSDITALFDDKDCENMCGNEIPSITLRLTNTVSNALEVLKDASAFGQDFSADRRVSMWGGIFTPWWKTFPLPVNLSCCSEVATGGRVNDFCSVFIIAVSPAKLLAAFISSFLLVSLLVQASDWLTTCCYPFSVSLVESTRNDRRVDCGGLSKSDGTVALHDAPTSSCHSLEDTGVVFPTEIHGMSHKLCRRVLIPQIAGTLCAMFWDGTLFTAEKILRFFLQKWKNGVFRCRNSRRPTELRTRKPPLVFPILLLVIFLQNVAKGSERRQDIINNDVDCIDYNANAGVFNLVCREFVLDMASDFSMEDYITLEKNEVFEGNDRRIILDGPYKGLLRINATSFREAPVIRRLHMIGGKTEPGGGFVIQEKQKHFIVDSCSSSGEIESGGGICGAECSGDILITNCWSLGSILWGAWGGAGGISGARIGLNGNDDNTKVRITQCHSTGDIADGGICGWEAGRNGHLSVTKSYSTGKIDGSHGGGICGSDTGVENGFVTIEQCYSEGKISGSDTGGITGHATGASGGIVHITDSYSRGNISGAGSGGICGFQTGQWHGTVIITNVYASGHLIGWVRGGIIGSIAQSATEISIAMSVYNDLHDGSLVGENYSPETFTEDKNSGDLKDITGKVYCFGNDCWNSVDIWHTIANDFPVLAFPSSGTSTPPTKNERRQDIINGDVSCIDYDDGMFHLICSTFDLKDSNDFDTGDYITLEKNEVFEGNGNQNFIKWRV